MVKMGKEHKQKCCISKQKMLVNKYGIAPLIMTVFCFQYQVWFVWKINIQTKMKFNDLLVSSQTQKGAVNPLLNR